MEYGIVEYAVAAILAVFAALIIFVLFRRHTNRADESRNAMTSDDPFAGVQRYAGQGDIIRYTGNPGHSGGGEGGDGDGSD